MSANVIHPHRRRRALTVRPQSRGIANPSAWDLSANSFELDDVGVVFSSGSEPLGLEEGPASDDAADGESSAHATPGVVTNAPPMPSATARAPTRPTYRAYRLVVQSMYATPMRARRRMIRLRQMVRALVPCPHGSPPRSLELPPTRCSRLLSHRLPDVIDQSVRPSHVLCFAMQTTWVTGSRTSAEACSYSNFQTKIKVRVIGGPVHDLAKSRSGI